MSDQAIEHEVIVLGAGVSGIYQLKRLVDLGADAIILEANEGLGGTWFKNRYPGCRFDSESYTYGYSFSREVLEEWDWKELFSAQPDTLEYLNFVASKFDLQQYMRFNSRVEKMHWQETERRWQITLTTGEIFSARFVVTCLGALSIPTTPAYPGIEQFQGEHFHTYDWPDSGIDLDGKRVGVIGTGATGIQVISEIADKVSSLTVFQRRPNWSSPLNNSPLSKADMDDIRARYDDIFAKCAETPGGFLHEADRRGFDNLSAEERRDFWDRLYDTPGFALLTGNFAEIFMEEDANRELSDYVADRIRARVNDPAIAEKLIPRDHGYGMQRVPLETNYFETYNRDNVQLVDITETPITHFTPGGAQTSGEHFDLDLIVFATGFDAITGALDRIDIRGVNGVKLIDKWQDGPITHLGVMTAGFPNLVMVAGPQSASGSTNFPRAIEAGVNWVSNLIAHTRGEKLTRLESQKSAEDEWNREVVRMQEKMLFRKAKSWFTGYNANIQGLAEGAFNPKVRYVAYWGGAPKYNALLKTSEEAGYPQIAKA